MIPNGTPAACPGQSTPTPAPPCHRAPVCPPLLPFPTPLPHPHITPVVVQALPAARPFSATSLAFAARPQPCSGAWLVGGVQRMAQPRPEGPQPLCPGKCAALLQRRCPRQPPRILYGVQSPSPWSVAVDGGAGAHYKWARAGPPSDPATAPSPPSPCETGGGHTNACLTLRAGLCSEAQDAAHGPAAEVAFGIVTAAAALRRGPLAPSSPPPPRPQGPSARQPGPAYWMGRGLSVGPCPCSIRPSRPALSPSPPPSSPHHRT